MLISRVRIITPDVLIIKIISIILLSCQPFITPKQISTNNNNRNPVITTDHEPDDKVMSSVRVMSRSRDNLVPIAAGREGEDPALFET